MNSVPQLFKERLIKSKLEKFNKESIPNFDEKFDEIKKWCKITQEKYLDQTKETSVQGTFMTSVFKTVFGYAEMIDGNCYNQERECKTSLDATESDGALGFFYKDTGKKDIRVVIELKDAKTSLDKKQNREGNHLTPVEQAFLYAEKNGKKCKWVIVSNFIETRLYSCDERMVAYEKFDMSLMDKEAEFLRFYYFLCKDHLIAEEGESLIDSLYQENEADSEEISKEFYKKYKQIRNELFENLKKNNSDKDELLLFTKAQKLMDRIIFICFCEDWGLLPKGIYGKLVETAKNSFSASSNKLWNELKGLFASMDKGDSSKKISRYNGGLFKEDPELDSLVISDEVLERFLELTAYDFYSDLNVNILGQIFEQSISDIEQIKNEINGVETKTISRQKQEGIFYTPYYVTRYIVKNTVGKYLDKKKETLKKEIFSKGKITIPVVRPSTGRRNDRTFDCWVDIPENKENMSEDEVMEREAAKGLHHIYWNAYENVLKEIKICDPACGSGAFLNQCFDYLKEQMDFVLDMKRQYDPQISMFDIDKEILQNNLFGVDINPESVEITKLSLWLKTAKNNQTLASLDDNIKCGNSIIDDASVVANPFYWEKEFKEIFQKGGFDIIVGNPPYGAALSQKEKDFITQNYKTTEYNFDTYKTFIELGMKILKQDGYLGYITPSTYFVLEKGATKLRESLFKEYTLTNIVELFGVFDSAIVEPAISIYQKRTPSPNDLFEVITVPRKTNLSSDFEKDGIVSKFKHQELVAGENLVFNYHATEAEKTLEEKIISKSKEMGSIFHITTGVKPYQEGKGEPKQTKATVESKPFNSMTKKDDTYMPYMKSGDVRAFTNSWKNEYISYGKWLAESNDDVIYQKEKLLVRQTGDYPIASYFNTPCMGNNSLHFVYYKEDRPVDLKYALGFLNSKLMKWLYQYRYFHMVSKPLACVKKAFVDRLPIVVADKQEDLINIVNELLKLSQERFDESNRFADYIEKTYTPKKISEKILYAYESDWKSFLEELKKQSVKLTEKQKYDFLPLFEDYSNKLKSISGQIEDQLSKLNAYMYQLYDLTEDEIRIIENHT